MTDPPSHPEGLDSDKFVLSFSLIIVAVCSTLSWYFIQQRRG